MIHRIIGGCCRNDRNNVARQIMRARAFFSTTNDRHDDDDLAVLSARHILCSLCAADFRSVSPRVHVLSSAYIPPSLPPPPSRHKRVNIVRRFSRAREAAVKEGPARVLRFLREGEGTREKKRAVAPGEFAPVPVYMHRLFLNKRSSLLR